MPIGFRNMTEELSLAVAALSAIATVGSFVAALLAYLTARRLGRIEVERRHEELVPKFHVVAKELSNGQVRLSVKLIGPAALEKIDDLTVTIRNDSVERRSDYAGSPTQGEMDAQLWSKYRLSPGISGADERGRTAGPIELLLGNESYYQLEPSIAPAWVTPEAWGLMFRGAPLRIALKSRRGQEPYWTVPLEVGVIPHLPNSMPQH